MRDGIDFFNICDGNTDGNAVIATFDAVGLYINIANSFRLETDRYF